MNSLVVEGCDPREHESEIRELFARNGQPEFDAVFERAYRTRAEQGLRSWIARLDGRAIMHISVTPLPFARERSTIVAGVLGDLMVDEAHRDFWGPVRLLRTVVADLKCESRVQFLLTTTTSEAEPVFKAGGFKPFGKLRRYVLPLSLPYLTLARIRGRAARHKPVVLLPGNRDRGELLASLTCTNFWRPQAVPEYYETRIPRDEFSDATWVGAGDNGAAGWALVSRSESLRELSLADLFWNESVQLGEVVHTAARWGRSQPGFARLTLTTIEESAVARLLERAGFFRRAIRSTLLVQQLGATPAPPVEDWFLPGFALSSW